MAEREGKLVIRAEAETSDAKRGLGELKESTENLGTGADQAAQDLGQLGTQAGQAAERARELDIALAGIDEAISKVKAGEMGEPSLSLQRGKENVEKLIEEFKNLGEAGARDVEKLRAAIGRIDEELEKMKSAGKSLATLAEPVRLGFERLERNTDIFFEKLQREADVSAEDIEKVWKAQILLDDAIKATGQSVQQMGPAAEANYNRLIQKGREATQTVVRLESAMEVSNAALRGQISGFSSLGDALQGLDGKAGRAAITIGGISAAAASGVAAGAKLNKLFMTDMQGWDAASEGFLANWRKRGALLLAGYSDAFLALVQEVKVHLTTTVSVASAAGKAIKQAIAGEFDEAQKTMREALIESGDKLIAQHKLTAQSLTNLKAAIDPNVDAMRAAADAINATTEKEKENKVATEKLKQAKRELRDEIDGVTRSLEAQAAAMQQQQLAAGSAGTKGIGAEGEAKRTAAEIATLNQQIEEQKKKLAETAKMWGEDSAMTQAYREELERLEAQLESAEARFTKATEEAKKYAEQKAKATEEAKKHAETLAELSKERQQLTDQTKASSQVELDEIKRRQQITNETDKYTVTTKDAATAIQAGAVATEQASVAIQQQSAAAQEGAIWIAGVKDAHTDAATAARTQADSVAAVNERMKEAQAGSEKTAGKVRLLKDELGNWKIVNDGAVASVDKLKDSFKEHDEQAAKTQKTVKTVSDAVADVKTRADEVKNLKDIFKPLEESAGVTVLGVERLRNEVISLRGEIAALEGDFIRLDVASKKLAEE